MSLLLISVTSMIHLYIAQRTLYLIPWPRPSGFSCCCGNVNGYSCSDGTERHTSRGIIDGFYQPTIRFYDEDESPPSEFHTSGFNTPRASQETLGSSERQSEDLV